MIHVIKIILYLVKKNIKKLEEKIKFKVLKSYMDILRMKQENFPKIELIKFANFIDSILGKFSCFILKISI